MRRKQPSVRRWKAKFLRGCLLPLEAVLDHPRIERLIKKHGFRFEQWVNYVRISQ